MKTLYIECNMGAAGDMLTAALLEVVENKEKTLAEMNAFGIPGVRFECEDSIKCGIKGTHMRVYINGEEEACEDVNCEEDLLTGNHIQHGHHHDHDHHHSHHNHHDHHQHNHNHGEHTHNSLNDIKRIIEDLQIPENVKDDVRNIYEIIAGAESRVHGAPIDEVHFHEVGAMDAVADVTAVAFLMNEINPDRVVVSPINTGKGQVKCQHGIIPVPAPAAALILEGIPYYNNFITGELCTPTGAALLKYFADEFGSMPVMKVANTGYGMGTKDFPQANCVRIFLGEQEKAESIVTELNFNVDDMTGEETGFATEMLLESGALEVFVTPVMMKKSRPGQLVTVICRAEDKREIAEMIFKYTTTIGIRETEHPRYVMKRHIETRESDYGSIRCKVSEGYGASRYKYEYDDLAAAARANGVTIEDVKKSIKE